VTGWGWPLDGVQGFFESMWSGIVSGVGGLINQISGWIWDAVNWLRDRVNEVGAWIWSQVKPVLGPIADWIARAASWAWSQLFEFARDPVGFIQKGVNWIGQVLNQVWTSLGQGLSSLGSSLGAALGQARDSIVSGVNGLAVSVSSAVGGAVDALGSALNGAMNTVGSWLSDALSGVARALGDALRGLWDWFATNIPAAAAAVGTFLTEHVGKPIMGALNWIVTGISDMLRGFYQSVLDFFRGHSPVTPEEAANYTIPLMLISGVSGLSAALIGTVGSLKVLGSGVEARALSDFIKDLFGLADMFRYTLAPILVAAYGQPIRYFYNAQFRPSIPTPGQADQMLFEGHMTEPEWRQIYAYHGWKDEHISAWYKTMFREPAQRTLLTMLEDPEISEAWVRRKIQELGFSPDDIEVLIGYKRRLLEAKHRAVLDPEKNRLRDNAKSDLVKGYIAEADLRRTLQALGYGAAEIEFHVQDAVQDRERKRRDLQVSTLQDAYVKAEIEAEDQLAALLTEYIVDPSLVNAMVDDAYVRRYKKPKAGAAA